MNEALKKAQKKYKQNKVDKITIEFYPTDEDIKSRLAERLSAGEPKATYIKRIIREDIKRSKKQ